MDKVCAYCGRLNRTPSDAYITREHVTPSFVAKASSEEHRMLYYEREMAIPSPAQIKDVCNYCNNGALSDLDGIGKTLYEAYFKAKITYRSKIFQYDFHPLARWLLKISYNSNRIANREQSLKVFGEKVVEYILGDRRELESLVVLGNIMPSPNIEKIDLGSSEKKAPRHLPLSRLRTSNIMFSDGGEPVLSKMLGIHNYYFSIFYPMTVDRLPQKFRRESVLLNGKSKVTLKAMKESYWESISPTAIRYNDIFEKVKPW